MNEEKKCEISIKLYCQVLANDIHRKQLLETECRQIKQDRMTMSHDDSKSVPESCISSHLTINESSAGGKFFVAADKIDVGERLLVEKALCSCLYPKNFGTHCTHCFVRLVAPIGCTDCASVAFCSVTCRDIALATYHKFECKFLDLLIGSGMSILCHLSLRMVIQCRTPDEALETGRQLSSVFCKNSAQRSNEDFFKRCLMSTFLLRCLQKAEFFGRRTTESAEPTPKELEVAMLLFSYLQALQFNAHEIYETVESGHKFDKSKINYIGVGIYKTGAMFNHECYPSITRYFKSTSLIFNSIRPQQKGEVVAENYGPIFSKQTLAERQRNLMSRYWFKCTCRACREDWPVLDKLDATKCRFRCPREACEGILQVTSTGKSARKETKCPLCKKNVSLQLSLEMLDNVEELFQQAAQSMDVSITSAPCVCVSSVSHFPLHIQGGERWRGHRKVHQRHRHVLSDCTTTVQESTHCTGIAEIVLIGLGQSLCDSVIAINHPSSGSITNRLPNRKLNIFLRNCNATTLCARKCWKKVDKKYSKEKKIETNSRALSSYHFQYHHHMAQHSTESILLFFFSTHM